MGFCLFVASGLSFDVDRYLIGSPFKARTVFRKGEIPTEGNPGHLPRPDSGFVVLVSQGHGQGLTAQIEAAKQFPVKYGKEMGRLKLLGVDNMLFDFGVELGGEIQHAEYLPPELLEVMVRFGMGLIFSTVQIPRG